MIDGSVYPDLDEPLTVLTTPEEQADYVARICGAWDFGIMPEQETFQLFRGWRAVFDRFPLMHSPAYAAFRDLFGWPPIPGMSVLRADYEEIDARNGRERDPCEGMI